MTAEFCLIQIWWSTPSPCLQIKILLRILLFQQNFVGIVIWQQNFVWYRHDDQHRPLVSKSKFCFEFCSFSRILSELWYDSRILSETDIIIYTVPSSPNQNSASNFVFSAEFCLIQTWWSTPSPSLQIKILLRILFFQQNFVGIVIWQQNFVWYRHDDWHRPLVSNSKFCFEFCSFSRILSELWYDSRILFDTDMMIDTFPCLQIKILLRILLFHQNFVRIVIWQQNFVWYRHDDRHRPLVSNSKFCFQILFFQQNFVRIVIWQQNFGCDFHSDCWNCGCDCCDCGSFRSYCGCDISFDCCSHYGCCSCCECCKCHRCCACRTYCCCCDYKIDKGSRRSSCLFQTKFCRHITILTKFCWENKIRSRILIPRQREVSIIMSVSNKILLSYHNSAGKAKF